MEQAILEVKPMNSLSLSKGPATRSSSDDTKAKTIAYWVTTGILVFCMTGGFFELMALRPTSIQLEAEIGHLKPFRALVCFFLR
jgi:hypothetical protein